jgi:predicted nucleotide-binding protein (sugar kinase/HSP70/actin superfamily)
VFIWKTNLIYTVFRALQIKSTKKVDFYKKRLFVTVQNYLRSQPQKALLPTNPNSPVESWELTMATVVTVENHSPDVGGPSVCSANVPAGKCVADW